MRLDKLLANMGYGSRKDVKGLIKKKEVTVNGMFVKDSSSHVDSRSDTVKVNNAIVNYQKYIYLMLNKPSGCVSATVDERDKTVIDLLSEHFQLFKPFPVGRLDKDTEGLLLLTNDGELAHQLTSPKKNIAKTYFAEIQGSVSQKDIGKFQEGIVLDDGYKAKSAKLEILKDDTYSEVRITVTEGKFHQVKRMVEAINKKVTYLKRISMGELILDDKLSTGEFRELNSEEMDYCFSKKGTDR